ncbi:MAG: ElyC/SanA/YdcF family protein [Flavobacteriales bacterium]
MKRIAKWANKSIWLTVQYCLSNFRQLFQLGIAFGAFVAFTTLASNRMIIDNAADYLYEFKKDIPKNNVGLVLGTSKFAYNRGINPYFRHRMTAAARLYHSGKVKHLVVSGDNHRNGYNEPQQMKDYLIGLGVKAEHITMDYAGFRTLDSMVRIKEIFGQTSVTVISQKFHNERAIYLAEKLEIKAVGYNAKTPWQSKRLLAREYLAKFKAVLDMNVLKTKPKFLGEKIEIPL